MTKHSGSNIIVALDHATDQQALHFLEQLDPALCRIKIGSVLFTHYGPSLLEKIQQRGFEIFLDLKFYDIPQTVAGACRAAAQLGIWMVNVHASGGEAMMIAAREAIQAFPQAQRPLLIAVTILTSLSDRELTTIGYRDTTSEMVMRLAQSAYKAGLDGVVCSAHEATMLRKNLPPNFLLVVPGIRLPESEQDDQKRIMTPEAALAAGADYLVIGRPITQSQSPKAKLSQILTTLQHP